ncbi:thiol-disulfide oxidoreductase DCC family protein [Flavobacterium sp. XGLA_31]|uniref:thiol-disulfide oxidoreductase DCC family protein n=1 Tax=Flavobacterium sp. XGLA_31 TaxID=3447666 RepID=UPI003F357B0A
MEIEDIPKDKKIILFDGVCNLCNTSVQLIIKRDKKDIFRFVPLQSDLGHKITTHIGISELNIDSLVLYEPAKAYYLKTEAVIRILSELHYYFKILRILLLLPKFISNWLYDYVAKNRYNWYGKKESCMIPAPDSATKFLA